MSTLPNPSSHPLAGSPILLLVLQPTLAHARHTSHVTRHTSHVTRHTSHVTRHMCLLGTAQPPRFRIRNSVKMRSDIESQGWKAKHAVRES